MDQNNYYQTQRVLFQEPSLTRRFIGGALDFIIVYIFATFFDRLLQNKILGSVLEPRSIMFFLGYFLYFFLFEAAMHATPGKILLKMRVTDELGYRPTSQIMLYRSLARFIPFDPLALLIRDPDGTRKTIHDVVSHSRVVFIP